jgi:hypothetical protein
MEGSITKVGMMQKGKKKEGVYSRENGEYRAIQRYGEGRKTGRRFKDRQKGGKIG